MSDRKILLVYTGPYYKNSQLSDRQLNEIVNNSGATDFLLLTAHTFNATKPGDKVLWPSWVNNKKNIPDSVFGTTNANSISAIRQGMLDQIAKFDQKDQYVYSYQEYVKDLVELARRMCNVNSNCKLWFGLPGILQNCQPAALCYNYYYKTYFYNPLKDALIDNGIWENCEGIYYGTEDVVSWYTRFDENDVANLFGNVVVQNMNNVSNIVHKDGKKFLWIPYYRDNVSLETVKRVGNIVNKTNIFDIVILQPNEAFGSYRNYGMANQQDMRNNIGFVESCVAVQKMLDKNRNVVGGFKMPSTEIGFEMEINKLIAENDVDEAGTTFAQRWNGYVYNFGKYVTGKVKRPCACYFDVATTMDNPEVWGRVKNFFKYGK